MPKPWGLKPVLAGLVTLTVLLSACNGSKPSAPAPAPADNAPKAQPPQPEAPKSDVPKADAPRAEPVKPETPKPAEAPKPRKALKVGYLNTLDSAQAMLAKDAGHYENHSLDVELRAFNNGADLINAIVGGQLQVGVVGLSDTVAAIDQGADIKVVASAQTAWHSIYVKKGSNIRTLANLKGKKLASHQEGSTADVVLRGIVLPEAGLKAADVTMSYMSPSAAIQSLSSGQVDAVFLFEPYDQLARATADVESIYEIGRTWTFPCIVVIASGKVIKDDLPAIHRLLDAHRDAILMIKGRPWEAAPLLTKGFIKDEKLNGPGGEVTPSAVIQKALQIQSFSTQITPADVNRMDDVVKLMVEQRLISRPAQAAKFLDLSWHQPVVSGHH